MYPFTIEQKNFDGKTGYDYLSIDSKQKIAKYISKQQLRIRKPEL